MGFRRHKEVVEYIAAILAIGATVVGAFFFFRGGEEQKPTATKNEKRGRDQEQKEQPMKWGTRLWANGKWAHNSLAAMRTQALEDGLRVTNTHKGHGWAMVVVSNRRLDADFTIIGKVRGTFAGVGIVDEKGRDQLIRLAVKPTSDWHRFRIVRKGRKLECFVRGAKVTPAFHKARPTMVGQFMFGVLRGKTAEVAEVRILPYAR